MAMKPLLLTGLGSLQGARPPSSSTGPMGSARRKRQVIDEEEEEAVERSLQLKNDERYVVMSKYKEKTRNRDDDSHFSRLVRASQFAGPGLQVPGHAGEQVGSERVKQATVSSIDQRMDWQEAFDHRVRRLLVDFDLTDVPSSRLDHLQRMHSWFEEHGAKQTRKTAEGPSYLVADRSGRMPAGSTKDLPSATSATTRLLSTTFARRPRSARPPTAA